MWLFRYFDKEEYAQDFINGKMRLMPISHYRTIEDSSRKDSQEGMTKYSTIHDRLNIQVSFFPENSNSVPNGFEPDSVHTVNEAPIYSWQWHCMCFSLQLSEELVNKFKAPFVCSVNLDDVIDRLNHAYFHNIISMPLRVGHIFYINDKEFFINNIHIKENNNLEAILTRDMFIKRLEYQNEHEFRIYAIAKANDHNNIIKASTPLDQIGTKEPICLDQEWGMKSAKLIDLSSKLIL